jgi:hypothetical protein
MARGTCIVQLDCPPALRPRCARACSVWTYCPREGGCFLPGGGEPRQLPRGGCRLVALPNFHPVVNSSTSFRVMGSQVPFMSGAGDPARGWLSGLC